MDGGHEDTRLVGLDLPACGRGHWLQNPHAQGLVAPGWPAFYRLVNHFASTIARQDSRGPRLDFQNPGIPVAIHIYLAVKSRI